MQKETRQEVRFEEFILNRIVDTEIAKSASIIAAREASKKLKDLPRILQSKKICEDLKR
ncbi:hypothetical protein KY347_04115 [Candidatus Woesearchaeota archaeon]|nr:hypothetical protein [Candidatus Woesearchaeota archaeon]